VEIEKIIEKYTTDSFIIANSPFKSQKVAKSAYIEWGQYMNELLVAKKEDIRQGKEQEGMDLMGESYIQDTNLPIMLTQLARCTASQFRRNSQIFRKRRRINSHVKR